MSFDRLGVDSLLQVLHFSGARSLARVACGSRFGFVVAHEAQQNPALLVLKGRPDDVARELRERLASRPTVAFLQYSGRTEAALQFARSNLPPDTEVLGANTRSLLCAVESTAARGRPGTSVEVDHGSDQIGLLLATLPEAKARAFLVAPPSSARAAARAAAAEDSEEHSSDDSDDSDEIEGQMDPPSGACATAGTAAPEEPSDEQALLSLDPAPEVVVVYLAGASRSANSLIMRLQAAYPRAAIIGGVVMGGEALAKSRATPAPRSGRGVGALAIWGNVPLYAMTCPFTGDVRQAGEDVRRKMRLTQEMAARRQEQILGALLFTCNGRGPRMFGRDANDALLFKERFPTAPLLGFYAGGEVGPEAVEEDDSGSGEGIFLRGNTCMQGFTAVYGMFLVPRKQAPSSTFQRAVLLGEVQAAFKELRSA